MFNQIRILKSMQTAFLLLAAASLACGCAAIKPKSQKTAVLGHLSAHEDCAELGPGQYMSYSWKSSGPLDFNIHHHEGGQIIEAVSKTGISSGSGNFYPKEKQYYCLMWTNKGMDEVDLFYNYKVEKAP
ncbi:MAG: hypothetical protein M0Z59_01225 [Nitrospiraceae bacterium]|nr:hypothetical protein [Nitrospiraceae bacterium]